jgi:helix-turn-helix, Psq domain
MGRIYKRKLGSRSYGKFSEDQIENALRDITNGDRSIRDAARTYKVSYGTLHNRFHGRRVKKTGGKTVLTANEVGAILNSIL